MDDELHPWVFSLNIDGLDVDELERRLEMAVASNYPYPNPYPDMGPCGAHCMCNGNSCSPCPQLTHCESYCL